MSAADTPLNPATPVGTPPRADAPEWRTRFAHTNYLNAHYGIKSWLFTRDHKRIALLYLISISIFFALGGFYAIAIRLELLTPAGDFFGPHTYNKLFTQHGILMIFFFLIPSIPAVLGNFLVPLDDRREGFGLSTHQPAQLVHLFTGRRIRHLGFAQRRH